MLFYTILLACISIFFFKEARNISQLNSQLLSAFNSSPSVAKVAAKQIFLISYSSAISAILMLLAFAYKTITNAANPKFLIALSFLIYGVGFMVGMYHCYKLKKEIH
ncbi:hypothetical protein [Anaerotignum sp.]|uniref:hypothetical protein n=1 Tax=Anaerotignum sp. TaxID=2039241 RepID=UPI0028A7A12B|nr:hypothetical protein [Anaerotignum sp.]